MFKNKRKKLILIGWCSLIIFASWAGSFVFVNLLAHYNQEKTTSLTEQLNAVKKKLQLINSNGTLQVNLITSKDDVLKWEPTVDGKNLADISGADLLLDDNTADLAVGDFLAKTLQVKIISGSSTNRVFAFDDAKRVKIVDIVLPKINSIVYVGDSKNITVNTFTTKQFLKFKFLKADGITKTAEFKFPLGFYWSLNSYLTSGDFSSTYYRKQFNTIDLSIFKNLENTFKIGLTKAKIINNNNNYTMLLDYNNEKVKFWQKIATFFNKKLEVSVKHVIANSDQIARNDGIEISINIGIYKIAGDLSYTIIK